MSEESARPCPPDPIEIVSSSWKASIDFAAVTDVGMRRSNNQDAHAAVPADSDERLRNRGHFFLVADGMGAHAAGELASRIASERVPLYYLRQSGGIPGDVLRDAVERANQDIFQSGQQNPEFHNMGTTVSTLAVLPDGAIVAHVGDSRVYRLRNDRLDQLTFDHSLVWEMQASGQIKPDSQLSGSIPKNIITRSLGPSSTVQVDVEGPFPLRAGDRFLLCSDGLTGQIDDSEIGPLLAALPVNLAAQFLVDLANLRGGPDNITVIVVDIRERPKLRQIGPTPETARPRWQRALTAVQGFFDALGSQGKPAKNHRAPAKAANELKLPRRSPPYRTTSAKPTNDLLDQLNQVITALREAARERRWSIDWTRVDEYLAEDQPLRQQGKLAEVIRLQAEAIVETMSQLRHQQPGNSESVLG